MTEDEPLPDAIAEGKRVIQAAESRDLTVRLTGGTAIHEHVEGPFTREYRDVDFVTVHEDKPDVIDLMIELGYEENKQINRMHRFRMEFWDPVNERKADYIVDRFEFCHAWGLRDRVDRDAPTLPIEDLLLSKLQIYEISDRDIQDIIAMLADHDVSPNDDTEVIDATYIADLCRADWGLFKTTTLNLDRVEAYLGENDPPVDETTVSERVAAIRDEIEDAPKSMRWKLRSLIGERKQWYKRPELT